MEWKSMFSVFRHISLEPVFLLFCINHDLIKIPTQDLYLLKACKVNLGLPGFVCENLQDRNVTEQFYRQQGNLSGSSHHPLVSHGSHE